MQGSVAIIHTGQGREPGDLGKMVKCIKPATQIFLFNFQSLKLLGVFKALGPAQMDIVKEAWGGKFGAQIKVTAVSNPIASVILERRMTCGTKDSAQAIFHRPAPGQYHD